MRVELRDEKANRHEKTTKRDQSGDMSMSMSYVIMPFSALTHTLIIFVTLVAHMHIKRVV